MTLVGDLTAASLQFGSQYAQQHAEGAMNSLIVLTRRGSYDEVSREYDESATEVLYDNPSEPGTGARAGVATAQGPMNMSVGDEPTYYSSVQIYLPQDGPSKNPRVDDVAYVVASPEADIVGRYFRVIDAPVGGRMHASIQLQCVGIAPSRQWST
jgi:hypothetical protein